MTTFKDLFEALAARSTRAVRNWERGRGGRRRQLPVDAKPVDNPRSVNRGYGDLGLNVADHDHKADMDAYDQLGPETRKVLDQEMPVPFSAKMTLDMVRSRGAHPVHHDGMIAAQLRSQIPHISAKLRSE
jgi:hypothetical protein